MNNFLVAVSKVATPIAILSVGSLMLTPANAQSMTLNAIDSGWYSSGGFHSPTNDTYVVGRRGPLDYNNFFVFNLSDINFPISSAELRVFNPIDAYQSLDPTETYTLFDVSTPVSTLTAGGFPLNAVYADLGSGISFGSKTVSATNNNSILNIPLNAAGVASLNNARGGLYAIGGSITTLFGLNTQSIFQSTGSSSIQQLVVTTVPTTVPEPSSSPFVALGLLWLIGVATRRR